MFNEIMMFTGILDLPWWGHVVVALIFTHITIAAVTIYLHRHSAHRALDLHPVVSHFFRFWLWLTTGMETRKWTAIHRKHHARCETEDDPHSPQTRGIRKVMWQGAELYKIEALNQQTIDRFGQGTPEDWIERSVYSSHAVLGIAMMMVIDLVLFGFIGLTIWAVQMLWIPLLAAGVINGVGHYWGYRSFQPEDASRNIVPWGILIGGEELHNNHHAYPASARLSSKWWEFDIGWLYIRTLALCGLASVKNVAPKVRLVPAKARCDEDTLHAVVMSRYGVLTGYGRTLKSACKAEIAQLRGRAMGIDWRLFKRGLHGEEQGLSPVDRERLAEALRASETLQTVHSMRRDLTALWQRSSSTKEQLVRQLEDWCQRAETSGIGALRDFSRRLRRYQLAH